MVFSKSDSIRLLLISIHKTELMQLHFLWPGCRGLVHCTWVPTTYKFNHATSKFDLKNSILKIKFFTLLADGSIACTGGTVYLWLGWQVILVQPSISNNKISATNLQNTSKYFYTRRRRLVYPFFIRDTSVVNEYLTLKRGIFNNSWRSVGRLWTVTQDGIPHRLTCFWRGWKSWHDENKDWKFWCRAGMKLMGFTYFRWSGIYFTSSSSTYIYNRTNQRFLIKPVWIASLLIPGFGKLWLGL